MKIFLSSLVAFTLSASAWADNHQVLFRYDGNKDGEYGVPYRIPAITTVQQGPHKGRLIAVSDYRYCHGDIGAGRIDLYLSTSDDNGASWTRPGHFRGADGQPVAQGTGIGNDDSNLQNLDCGFGDAAIVSDRETGELLMVACCGHMNFGRSMRANPQPSARWWSTDGGDTWTAPDYTHWEQVYALFDGTAPGGYIDSQFIGSGRIFQSPTVKVGSHYRVYCVNTALNKAEGYQANWVLYSDDLGRTWAVLGGAETPAVPTRGDEPKCEELPDGSILLASRRAGNDRNFNIFRYTDVAGGRGTWGEVCVTDMGNPGGTIQQCNGEIMILPVKNSATGARAYIALQSFPAGPMQSDWDRRNVSIGWKLLASAEDFDSPADFAKWDGFHRVSNIGSGYSTMTLQHDGRIGFLYEEDVHGCGYSIVYAPITLSEITDGQWELL